jgi:hypothetical protein
MSSEAAGQTGDGDDAFAEAQIDPLPNCFSICPAS